MAVVRLVDERHIMRVAAAQGRSTLRGAQQERPVVAAHREEVRELLESRGPGWSSPAGTSGCSCGSCTSSTCAPFVPETVVAWSAGAMALTERVVLFHDRAPQGPAHAEVYDEGLGLITRSVLLPHARRRLRIDDVTRMSVLGIAVRHRRCCVVLDDGTRIDLTTDGGLPDDARVVGADGRIRASGSRHERPRLRRIAGRLAINRSEGPQAARRRSRRQVPGASRGADRRGFSLHIPVPWRG